MNGISQEQPTEQKPNILQEFEFGVGGVLLGIGTFLLLLFVLNYFNLVSLSQVFPKYFGFLPHRASPVSPFGGRGGPPSQTFNPAQSQIPSPTPIPAQKLTLSCPVPKEFCGSGKKVDFNGNTALAYLLPEGTKIQSIAPVIDSQQFVTQPYRKENPIGLYQSYITNNDCYTATYIFSSDSVIYKINLLPLEKDFPLATVSANLIPNTEEANFILQIQKRPLDKTTPGQPDDQRCPVVNLQPKDFGQYQTIDISLFE